MEDRLMTVKQLAEYLSVNDRTVLKLVSDGALPGVKVGNQWRFRKAMIDTWLDDQMLGVMPRYLDPPKRNGSPRRMLELASCFQPDHIIPELEAVSRNAVVEELAGLASRLGLIRDKIWFVRALIERENVMPSAMGNGIAFLHKLPQMFAYKDAVMAIMSAPNAGAIFEAVVAAERRLEPEERAAHQ